MNARGGDDSGDDGREKGGIKGEMNFSRYP